MSKTESIKTTVEWKTTNWRKLERVVFKLQKRIYQASQRGDVKAVRKLQKTLVAIHASICKKPKYVLDADISKCFDRINHDALLHKLNTFPTMRRLIKSWLKAVVVDWSGYANRKQKKETNPTLEGTPQGGVISPLLANIALHGLENRLLQYVETLDLRSPGGYKLSKQWRRSTLGVIRYADDFVVLHEDKAVVQKCMQITAEWLRSMGLELKPEKTRLSHTLIEEGGKVGFDFLGFTIRQFKVGKYVVKQGFQTIITPSKESLKAHTQKIGTIIEEHKSLPKEALISKLNPVIRGWCNYHKSQCSKLTFSKADNITYQQMKLDASSIFNYTVDLQRYRELIEGKQSSILQLGCLFISIKTIHDLALEAAIYSRTKQTLDSFTLDSLVKSINVYQSSLSSFFVFDLMMKGVGCSCQEFIDLVRDGKNTGMANTLEFLPPKYSIKLTITAGAED
ncbi:reverse transcriptase domain-containing protein [Planktothrix sp. FACHB-1365]|uniref:reverse transcriptase domain-containing protein n=1 Tax=Planktothrix sp. FACHB-1365 TaxID=2692855 RepID=UPI001688123D|nr:reverse transcriptase domain-containing protein [Planktothrix sp. FACHB-1365]MBD2485581.1 reverse transcriptase N-terminal domain-containing protein [Planktothrix sp. FACHB-1365]